MKVEEHVEVSVPVRTAYNQWTQFTSFPEFMGGVKRVDQIDDTTTHWVTDIGGVQREFDAVITEQRPDERIAWSSVSGPRQAGAVSFRPVGPERTDVTLEMEYEPESLVNAGGNSFKGNGCRVGTVNLRANGWHAHAVTPGGKLFCSGSAEGVGGAQQDVLVFSDENSGHLADGGGLAYAVDTDNHDDARAVRVRFRQVAAVQARVDQLEQFLAEHGLDAGRVLAAFNLHSFAQRVDKLKGRFGTQVCHQQVLFNLFPDILVNRVLAEQGQQALGEHVVGLGQSRTQAGQAALHWFRNIELWCSRCGRFLDCDGRIACSGSVRCGISIALSALAGWQVVCIAL